MMVSFLVRSFFAVLGAGSALLVGLLVGIALLLLSPTGREALRPPLVALLGDALGVRIEIDVIDRLGPTHAAVSGVRIRDPHGRVVASARSLSVWLDPSRLLTGQLSFTRANVEHPVIDLGDPGGAGGGLPDAFEEDLSPEPIDDTSEGLHVRFENLRVVRGTLVITGADASRLRLVEIDALGEVDVADALRVGVIHASGTWDRDGRPFGSLFVAAASYTDAAHEPWRALVEVRSGAARALVHASWQRRDARGQRPYRAQGRVERLSGESLAGFGVDARFAETDGLFMLHGQAAEDFEHGSMHVVVAEARYDGMRMPEVFSAGQWSSAAGVWLPIISATYPGGRVRAGLSVDADGCIDARGVVAIQDLRALPPIEALAPGLRGGLVARLRLATDKDQRITLRGMLNATHLGYAEADVERMRVVLALHGHDGSDLQGEVAIHAESGRVARMSVSSASLRITGGPRAFVASGSFGGGAAGERDVRGWLHAHVKRSSERAEGDVTLALSSGKYGSLGASVRGARYTPRRLELGVMRAWLGHATLAVAGHVGLGGHASRLRATLHVPDLASALAPFGDPDADVEGSLSVVARAEGRRRAPLVELDARYRAPRLGPLRGVVTAARISADLRATPSGRAHADAAFRFDGDDAPIHVALDARYAPRQVALEMSARDRKGPLLRTAAQTDLFVGGIPSAASLPSLLLRRAWDATLWLSTRRVAELPGAHLLSMPRALLPARVAGAVRVAHRPGMPLDGEATLHVDWAPEPRTVNARCGGTTRPYASIVAHMAGGVLDASASVQTRGRERLRLTSRSRAPLDHWFGAVRPVPARFDVELSTLRLAELPIVCEHIEGTVDGRATLDVSAERLSLHGNWQGRALRVREAEAFDADVVLGLERASARVGATLRSPHGRADIVAHLPLDGTGRMPTLRTDAPIAARVDLKRVDVPALLAPVPQVVARSGTLSGTVRWAGTLQRPEAFGRLRLDDVTLVLPELGQPFEHVDGVVEVSGRRLRLERTRVHDRDGYADISGELELRRWGSFRSTLDLDANRLPVRRAGVILARLDGKLRVTADVDPAGTDVTLALRELDLQLTGDTLDEVQALRLDPRIVLVDGDQKVRSDDEADARATPLVVHVRAEQPFWMRRDDFSVLLSTTLRVEVEDDEPSVTGSIEIERGVVELLGYVFDIESGRIEFSGGHEIAPTLALTASRRAAGGSTVALTATGSVREPTLTFLVDGTPVTAGEALAALSGSRGVAGSNVDVAGQVGSVASGIVAGVLSVGARRQFGEWVPVLAVENDPTETRVRVGIAARSLIPKALRKVVVDAYVEGMLVEPKNGPSGASGAQGTGAAVLLELWFPNDFVGEAQLGPAGRWSTDLSWEP